MIHLVCKCLAKASAVLLICSVLSLAGCGLWSIVVAGIKFVKTCDAPWYDVAIVISWFAVLITGFLMILFYLVAENTE